MTPPVGPEPPASKAQTRDAHAYSAPTPPTGVIDGGLGAEGAAAGALVAPIQPV